MKTNLTTATEIYDWLDHYQWFDKITPYTTDGEIYELAYEVYKYALAELGTTLDEDMLEHVLISKRDDERQYFEDWQGSDDAGFLEALDA